MTRMLSACLLGAVLVTTSCVYWKSTHGVSYPLETGQAWSPGAPVTANRTPLARTAQAAPAVDDLPAIQARGFLPENRNTCSEK